MGAYKTRIDAERGGQPVKLNARRERSRRVKEQNRAFHEYTMTHRPAPHTQLKRLDYRLGVGVGATKERAKLRKLVKA